jgi:hypothetical protein
MSLGSMYLRIRQKYSHGLRTAYWRDRVRPQILHTEPIRETNSDRCEIHLLTCVDDWLNAIWTLKTFYWYSGRDFRLCIHEDGSLMPAQRQSLQTHFPNARLIPRPAADARLLRILATRHRSATFRNANSLALKVFDFAAFLECDRMLLLDSDILFFAEPKELLSRIENATYCKNTLNKDWALGYPVEPCEWADRLSFSLPSLINSGLGLIHRESIQLDVIEEFLGLPGILAHSHRVEQTLIALYSARFGFEFLPQEYDVRTTDGEPTPPCRHYTGPIRHLMYSQGVRYLVRLGILNNPQQCRHR